MDTLTRVLRAFPTEYVDSEGERFFDTLLDCCPLTTVDEMVIAISARDSSATRIAEAYRDSLRLNGLESLWAEATAAMVNADSGARLLAVHRDTGTRETIAFTWADFVTAQQDFWSTWGGTDWPAWRDAFRRTAEQYDLAADAEARLGWLDALSTAERARYLQDTLGFNVNPAAFETTPKVPEPAPE